MRGFSNFRNSLRTREVITLTRHDFEDEENYLVNNLMLLLDTLWKVPLLSLHRFTREESQRMLMALLTTSCTTLTRGFIQISSSFRSDLNM
jgi:hypothetical protein